MNTIRSIFASVVPTSAPAQPFIILARPRTGSTLLQSLLDSHPNIVCMNELAKDRARVRTFRGYFLGRRRKLLKLKSDPHRFVRTLLLSSQPSFVKAIGFKIMFQQDSIPFLKAVSRVEGLKVLHISRDPLRSAISFAIARESGSWAGTVHTTKFEIDPDYILKKLDSWSELEARAMPLVSGKEILHVRYEELATRPDVILRGTQEFLGVPIRKLHTRLKKQVPRVREAVVNYDALMEAVQSHQERIL